MGMVTWPAIVTECVGTPSELEIQAACGAMLKKQSREATGCVILHLVTPGLHGLQMQQSSCLLQMTRRKRALDCDWVQRRTSAYRWISKRSSTQSPKRLRALMWINQVPDP